ncbi:MAG: hypothetical protein GU355_01830 [Caldivirga sp.]|jgi:hypothetical protein|nr:hypothetical protein [Caldivirga sp.]
MAKPAVKVAIITAAAVLLVAMLAMAQGNYENYVKIISVNYTNPVEVNQPANITVLVEYAPPCLITAPNSCMSTIMVALNNGTLTLASLPINTAPGILKFVFTVTLVHVGYNLLNVDLYYWLNGTWILVDRRMVNITVEPKLTVRSYTYTVNSSSPLVTSIVNTTTLTRFVTLTSTATVTKTVTRIVNSTVYLTTYIMLTSVITVTTNVSNLHYIPESLLNISVILSVITLILSTVVLLVLIRYLAVRGKT